MIKLNNLRVMQRINPLMDKLALITHQLSEEAERRLKLKGRGKSKHS